MRRHFFRLSDFSGFEIATSGCARDTPTSSRGLENSVWNSSWLNTTFGWQTMQRVKTSHYYDFWNLIKYYYNIRSWFLFTVITHFLIKCPLRINWITQGWIKSDNINHWFNKPKTQFLISNKFNAMMNTKFLYFGPKCLFYFTNASKSSRYK